MTNILHIDSSARLEGSITRQLSAEAVRLLTADQPTGKIVYHDLARHPLPPIDTEYVAEKFGKTMPSPLPPSLQLSDALIAEIFAADVLVLGVPMYNFSVPSTLKSWIDYVCRARKTFRYSASGPEGLITGKKAILLVGTGGAYSAGPYSALDHVVPYMKQVLGFIGIKDVTVIAAEKQGVGGDIAASELATARARLTSVLTKAA